MKIRLWIAGPLLLISITGCGASDLARSAADATACKALDSTIKTIATSYQSGLIDSGLVSQIDSLVGEQARALLSTGFAEDLKLLTETLAQTQTAEGSRNQIASLTESILKRCSEVGVGGIGQ